MDLVKLSDDLAFSDQPTFRELRHLRRLGYRTLVDVRLPAEQLAPEEDAAARAGLRFVRLPIAQPEWSTDLFDEFAAVVRRADGNKIIVHSGQGARAGILTLTYHAVREGWTVEVLEEAARQLGLDLPEASRSWVYQHSMAYDSARRGEELTP
jgi:protein tyrosine phosphatase (PTP) superfamily phosphohydrolase (DUF442 family)